MFNKQSQPPVSPVDEDRTIEYECGIDLAIPRLTPDDVLDALFAELNAAINEAFSKSKIAAEWDITKLGLFGERV